MFHHGFFIIILIILAQATAFTPMLFNVLDNSVIVERGEPATFRVEVLERDVSLNVKSTTFSISDQMYPVGIHDITIPSVNVSATYDVFGKSSGLELLQTVTIIVFAPVKISTEFPSTLQLTSDNGTFSTVSCLYTGTHPVTIQWFKNDNFSTLVSGEQTLSLSNADVGDSGNFTCIAKNERGGKVYNDSRMVMAIAPPGAPTILRIDSNPCWNGLNVTWKPNVHSHGYMHKMVLSFMNGTVKQTRFMESPTNSPQTKIFENLDPMMKYVIKITVCQNESNCYSNLEVRNYSTAGVVRPIAIASIVETTKRGGCKIIWGQLPLDSMISRFKIVIESNSQNGNSAQSQLIEIPSLSSEHVPLTLPNRVYSFSLQAENCAGKGEARLSNGTCTTPPTAPPNISVPTTTSTVIVNGRISVGLHPVDESNGYISCFFLIGTSSDGVMNEHGEPYSMEQLRLASQLAEMGTGSNMGKEYIVYAYTRAFIGEKGTTLEIGNGERTHCNINSTGEIQIRRRRANNVSLEDVITTVPSNVLQTRTSNDVHTTAFEGTTTKNDLAPSTVFHGQNFPLIEDEQYRFFIVSVTPSDNDFFFQRSPELVTDYPANWVFVIFLPVAIPVVMIIVLIIVILLLRARKSTKPLNVTQEAAPVDAQEMIDTTPENDLYLNPDEIMTPVIKIESSMIDHPKYENLRVPGSEIRETTEGLYEPVRTPASEDDSKEEEIPEITYDNYQSSYENLKTTSRSSLTQLDAPNDVYEPMASPRRTSGATVNNVNVYLEPMPNSDIVIEDAVYENLGSGLESVESSEPAYGND